MAVGALARCLAVTRAWEGGAVDHPKDPGGATKWGVTQAVYTAWRSAKGLPYRHVFQISEDECQAIYRERYWTVIRGDELPAGVDLATFDAAVNSGPARGAAWLRRAIGHVPGKTVDAGLVAAVTARGDAAGIARRICDARLGFVQGLRTWGVFGKGWARRIADIRARSVAMAVGGGAAAAAELRKDAAAAETKSKGQAGAAGATTAGAGGGAAVQADQVAAIDWTPWLTAGAAAALLVLGATILVLALKARQQHAIAAAAARLADTIETGEQP